MKFPLLQQIYLKQIKSSCKRAKLWKSDKMQMQSTTYYTDNPHSKPRPEKWWRCFGDESCTQRSWGALTLLYFLYFILQQWPEVSHQLAHSLENPLPCVSLGVLAPHWPSYTPPNFSRSQALSSRMLSILHQCPFKTPQTFPNQKGKKKNIFSK